MSKKDLNIKGAGEQLGKLVGIVQRYSIILFLVFVACLYGFVAYQISSLSSAEPSPDAVSSQVKAAAVPHIDPTVIKQLQSLQDNSVSVKTLFNQARDSPFQE